MLDDTSEEVDIEDVDNEEDASEASRPLLRDTQFRLASFFVLTAVCGVYFFLERTFHGEFGKHALGATVLIFGVAVPAIAFTFWVLRACLSVAQPFGTILLMAVIGGAIALGLMLISGF